MLGCFGMRWMLGCFGIWIFAALWVRVVGVISVKSLFLLRIIDFLFRNFLLIRAIKLTKAIFIVTQIKKTLQQFIKGLLLNYLGINNLISKLLSNIILINTKLEGHFILFLLYFFPVYWSKPLQPFNLSKTLQSPMHITLNKPSN